MSRNEVRPAPSDATECHALGHPDLVESGRYSSRIEGVLKISEGVGPARTIILAGGSSFDVDDRLPLGHRHSAEHCSKHHDRANHPQHAPSLCFLGRYGTTLLVNGDKTTLAINRRSVPGRRRDFDSSLHSLRAHLPRGWRTQPSSGVTGRPLKSSRTSGEGSRGHTHPCAAPLRAKPSWSVEKGKLPCKEHRDSPTHDPTQQERCWYSRAAARDRLGPKIPQRECRIKHKIQKTVDSRSGPDGQEQIVRRVVGSRR